MFTADSHACLFVLPCLWFVTLLYKYLSYPDGSLWFILLEEEKSGRGAGEWRYFFPHGFVRIKINA